MSKAEIDAALFGKRSKYRAVRTEVDGIWFASKREALDVRPGFTVHNKFGGCSRKWHNAYGKGKK